MHPLHTTPVTLVGDDCERKRDEIRSYFHKTCDLYELGFQALKDDSVFFLKSEPTRHPMIFYFGHTATFYVNKLVTAGIIDHRINPEFESLFAIGVDEMSWDDMHSGDYQWPEVQAVREYRNQVRALVDDLITQLPLKLPISQEDPFWIILMGIEHERIHLETSSVLHRQMPIDKVKVLGGFPCPSAGEAPTNTLVDIEGATISLGKRKDHHLYGWDNEYGHAEIQVQDFKTSKFLVSNGEFMHFVEDGGYQNHDYWDDEGQEFLQRRKATHPVFWIEQEDGTFKYRSLTHIINMPWNWPVDVNYLEAKAFCRWKTEKEALDFRLPTEAEWYHLYERAGLHDVPDFDDSRANINLSHYASSCPVDEFAFGDLYDVVGNAWQWTESAIDALEGFEVHPAYDDFSTPTFDGKHNLMKGGSWVSTGNEIMKHSRYAFRRHFYQHAGFRYVQAKEAPVDSATTNTYETDDAVAQYCEFQYGPEYFSVANYAKSCAELTLKYARNKGKALDLGCATGRSSFELAKNFTHVTGIDFSARFIQACSKLKESGEIRYRRSEEGALTSEQTRTLESFSLQGSVENTEFWQGDACNLKPKFTGYDAILASNLIDRLYEPKIFLESAHERLNPGGVLVLTSPYTWLEEYTKTEHWVGGFTDNNGVEVSTLGGLKAILLKQFELVTVSDIEFVIRETPRKYQHSIAQATVWRKRF